MELPGKQKKEIIPGCCKKCWSLEVKEFYGDHSISGCAKTGEWMAHPRDLLKCSDFTPCEKTLLAGMGCDGDLPDNMTMGEIFEIIRTRKIISGNKAKRMKK